MTEVLTPQTNFENMHELANVCTDNGQDIPLLLTTSLYTERRMIRFGEYVINKHIARPIDLLVGDDVSGRVPTLIARKLLQQSHEAGITEEAPATVFMASGRLRMIIGKNTVGQELTWQEALNDRARAIYAKHQPSNALIVTETVSSGHSIQRLYAALVEAGVSHVDNVISSEDLYLRNKPNADREAVGLVKRGEKATSFVRIDYDGEQARALRQFLNAYSKYLFALITNRYEEPAGV